MSHEENENLDFEVDISKYELFDIEDKVDSDSEAGSVVDDDFLLEDDKSEKSDHIQSLESDKESYENPSERENNEKPFQDDFEEDDAEEEKLNEEEDTDISSFMKELEESDYSDVDSPRDHHQVEQEKEKECDVPDQSSADDTNIITKESSHSKKDTEIESQREKNIIETPTPRTSKPDENLYDDTHTNNMTMNENHIDNLIKQEELRSFFNHLLSDDQFEDQDESEEMKIMEDMERNIIDVEMDFRNRNLILELEISSNHNNSTSQQDDNHVVSSKNVDVCDFSGYYREMDSKLDELETELQSILDDEETNKSL